MALFWPRVTFFSFKSLIFKPKLSQKIKWNRKKVSFEALSCPEKRIFTSFGIKNRVLKSKKSVCDISATPPPLSVTYYLNDPKVKNVGVLQRFFFSYSYQRPHYLNFYARGSKVVREISENGTTIWNFYFAQFENHCSNSSFLN